MPTEGPLENSLYLLTQGNAEAVFANHGMLRPSSVDAAVKMIKAAATDALAVGEAAQEEATGAVKKTDPGAPSTVNTVDYLAVTLDPSGRVTEDAIDREGQVPPWVLSRWRERMGATKVAPLALSLPGSVSLITAASRHVRVPFKLPAPIKRARLHVRNYNDILGLTYTGPVTFTSVHVGAHALSNGELTGNFATTPTQALGTFTTPTDGSEYVSAWFNVPGATGDDLLLSYGFTTDGTMSIHRGIGACWTSSANTEAGQATPTTALTAGYQPPLDLWLECEIDGRVPVVMYLGDSLTAGYGATWPIYDSWATRHALSNGAWPWVNGHTGSMLYNWSSALSYWRWAKHVAMTAPDAAVVAAGSNDISNSRTDMQTTLAAVMANIRALGTKRIHLATIMPRNFDATKEAARVDYNTWLRQLPLGAVNVWDFSRAIESATGAATVLPAYNFDGTHLNRGGYARMAATVAASVAQQHA